MKISPPVEAVADEIEAWALAAGWKTVALAIAEQYHASGGGDILPVATSELALKNVIQRVRRILRGCDGPRYRVLAEQLKPAALAALPAERRAHIESPGDPILLAARAAKEGIKAVNAVNLGAAPALIIKEINEAVSAFLETKAAFERMSHDEGWLAASTVQPSYEFMQNQ
ncbi:toxin YdaT family protein [Mixta intestinalis]|uniref:Uncharacterized protein n=1 Tax=Mixta intestinalis TaxID=1615494 RepID=A0A6P1Q0F3_9GAMM|nr:toxin YdaT family protein [Mixta intestinalis]QHM71315.1 hypothetical protein C7M51_01601 [Mixta intestinalis]